MCSLGKSPRRYCQHTVKTKHILLPLSFKSCPFLNIYFHFFGCRQREKNRNLPLTLMRRWIWNRYALFFHELIQFKVTILPTHLYLSWGHYIISNSSFTFVGNVLSTDCCTGDEQKKDANNNLQCRCNLWKCIVAKIYPVHLFCWLSIIQIKCFTLWLCTVISTWLHWQGGWYIPAQATQTTSKRWADNESNSASQFTHPSQ